MQCLDQPSVVAAADKRCRRPEASQVIDPSGALIGVHTKQESPMYQSNLVCSTNFSSRRRDAETCHSITRPHQSIQLDDIDER